MTKEERDKLESFASAHLLKPPLSKKSRDKPVFFCPKRATKTPEQPAKFV